MSLEERIQEIIKNKKEVTPQKSTLTTMTNHSLKDSSNCSICSNTTWVPGEDGMVRCKCYKKQKTLRLWANSGLTSDLKTKTFDAYKPYNKDTQRAKVIAANYAKDFDHKSSIAFIGQVGSGKTHLALAIMLNLLGKNIGTIYFTYRQEVTRLKQNIMDDEIYQKEMSKFKNCQVLLIDDLFKGGKVTDADIKIMFEIINHRYINAKPIIISSELTIDNLLDIDEAVGSRIYEMSREYLVEIRGKDNNYRMRG